MRTFNVTFQSVVPTQYSGSLVFVDAVGTLFIYDGVGNQDVAVSAGVLVLAVSAGNWREVSEVVP